MTDPPTAKSAFDQFMRGAIGPSFNDAGFRRKCHDAGTWHRGVMELPRRLRPISMGF
jgi:hypothetical protein